MEHSQILGLSFLICRVGPVSPPLRGKGLMCEHWQVVGLCGPLLASHPLLPDTHSVVESVGARIHLASEQGAVMTCGLTPGSVKVIGQEADEVQVSGEERSEGEAGN